jgi:quercetin dioxygenase-like cupin family protein
MTARREPRIVPPGQGKWLCWLGHPTEYLARGEDTDESYALSWNQIPSGLAAPPHRHSFHEGFYILKGEITFAAGNQTVVVPAGGFLNVAADVGHWPRSSASEDTEVLVLSAPSGFDRFQFEAGDPVADASGPFEPATPAHVERMKAVASKYGIDLNPPKELFKQPPRLRLTQPGEGQVIALVGDLYRFLAISDDTDGSYAIWEALVSPGGGPPPHVHSREDEGFYVLKGQINFHFEDQTIKAGPGTFLNLPKGRLHWFHNDTDQPARTLILVAPAGFEGMFLETGTVVPNMSVTPPPVTSAEIKKLLEIAPKYGVEIKIPPQE